MMQFPKEQKILIAGFMAMTIATAIVIFGPEWVDQFNDNLNNPTKGKW